MKGRLEMSDNINRRNFLKNSLLTSAGIVSALGFEEQTLLAAVSDEEKGETKPAAEAPASKEPVKGLQTGKIGKLTISRLLCGGNLISGYAHSRNLIYVSSLMKHYFTDEKIIETFRICEENGINTAVLRLDDKTIKILNKYWKSGGKIQWIAQLKPTESDQISDAQKAVDNGAKGGFSHGGVGDTFFENGRVDLLGKTVSFLKEKGLIAGVGAHSIDVVMAAEDAKLDPDFYFKTLNTADYECEAPEKTIEYMQNIKKPWIGFKVLGAGVKKPQEGFKYAFDGGADFINVGMYDFQIKTDAAIAKEAIENAKARKRPWMG